MWWGIGLPYVFLHQLICGTLFISAGIRVGGGVGKQEHLHQRAIDLAPWHMWTLYREWEEVKACSWHMCSGQYATWRNIMSRHSWSVTLTLLSSSSSLCPPEFPTCFFNKFFRGKKIGWICKYVKKMSGRMIIYWIVVVILNIDFFLSYFHLWLFGDFFVWEQIGHWMQ